MKYIDLAQKPKQAKPKKKKRRVIGVVLLLLIFATVAGLWYSNDVRAIFDPVHIVGTFASADLKETDGRTNILVLGSDKRTVGEVESVLTDTILVASIGRVEKDIVLISLPRDLWVKSPQGYYTKINAIYSNGGATDTQKIVEDVLDLPIHYYAVIDFNLFVEVVDTLGGIEVDVENDFVDNFYPIEGKENAPFEERYETIEFKAGLQTMDGERALKYARSRKGNNNEGTDFARSARQQKVIMALKDRALSIETIINPSKLASLYELYSSGIDSNIALSDVQNFYLLSEQIQFQDVESIVLDDRSAAEEGGLLHSPEDTSLYQGAYVLLPNAGDFSQLHAYVKRYVFGE